MFLLPILNDSFIKVLKCNNLCLNSLTDKNYCLISLKSKTIHLSLFISLDKDVQNICQINFSALSCNKLFHLISCHNNINKYISFNHALYIGKEIYKAELSKTFQQIYVQL